MRVFYFNVRHGSVVYEDLTGQVLPGRPEAWGWALRDAQSLIDDGVLEDEPSSYWIEILDHERKQVATVPLAGLDWRNRTSVPSL